MSDEIINKYTDYNYYLENFTEEERIPEKFIDDLKFLINKFGLNKEFYYWYKLIIEDNELYLYNDRWQCYYNFSEAYFNGDPEDIWDIYFEDINYKVSKEEKFIPLEKEELENLIGYKYLGREGIFDDSKPLKNEEEFRNLKSNNQLGKIT